MTTNLPATIPETTAAIGEAQERNDFAAANALYAHEQNLRRQPATAAPGAPAVSVGEPFSAAEVEGIFADMAKNDAAGADALRAEWGAAAGGNLGIIEEYLEANLSAADKENLPDDPASYRIGLVLARKWRSDRRAAPAATTQRTAGNPAPAGRPAPVASEAYAITMRDYSARIDQALGEGNHRLANAIEEQKREWLRTVVGNQPAVGHNGRTA